MKEVILFYGYKYLIWETSNKEETIRADAKENLYKVVAIREITKPPKFIEPRLKKNDYSLMSTTKEYIKEHFKESEIEPNYKDEILGNYYDREIAKLQNENIELQKELDECDRILAEDNAYNQKIDDFIAWTKTVDDELLMQLYNDASDFDTIYKKYEQQVIEYLEKKRVVENDK